MNSIDNIDDIQLSQEGQSTDTMSAQLSPVMQAPGVEEAFNAILGTWDANVITRVTRQAAEKLNLGLLASTLNVIVDIQRTREKIQKLEAIIYTPQGVCPDKAIISLYNSEKATLASQIETVRKYVLNNKSALEEIDKPVKDLVEALSQLPADKLAALKGYIDDLKSDASVNDDNLLGEIEGN